MLFRSPASRLDVLNRIERLRKSQRSMKQTIGVLAIWTAATAIVLLFGKGASHVVVEMVPVGVICGPILIGAAYFSVEEARREREKLERWLAEFEGRSAKTS